MLWMTVSYCSSSSALGHMHTRTPCRSKPYADENLDLQASKILLAVHPWKLGQKRLALNWKVCTARTKRCPLWMSFRKQTMVLAAASFSSASLLLSREVRGSSCLRVMRACLVSKSRLYHTPIFTAATFRRTCSCWTRATVVRYCISNTEWQQGHVGTVNNRFWSDSKASVEQAECKAATCAAAALHSACSHAQAIVLQSVSLHSITHSINHLWLSSMVVRGQLWDQHTKIQYE